MIESYRRLLANSSTSSSQEGMRDIHQTAQPYIDPNQSQGCPPPTNRMANQREVGAGSALSDTSSGVSTGSKQAFWDNRFPPGRVWRAINPEQPGRQLNSNTYVDDTQMELLHSNKWSEHNAKVIKTPYPAFIKKPSPTGLSNRHGDVLHVGGSTGGSRPVSRTYSNPHPGHRRNVPQEFEQNPPFINHTGHAADPVYNRDGGGMTSQGCIGSQYFSGNQHSCSDINRVQGDRTVTNSAMPHSISCSGLVEMETESITAPRPDRKLMKKG